MNYPKAPLFLLAAAMSTSPLALANDEDEIPFDEARLFFELNDTDGDLGIHGKIDGDEWKYLEIEDPRDRKMMNIWVRGRLRRQGLTELFFESAEPTFDELDPARFFKRFPEGEYDIEGYTLDGEERESEVYLSHVIPSAPDGVSVNGHPLASLDSCEGEEGADPIPVVDPEIAEDEEIVIEWEAVTQSHASKHADDDEKIALGKKGPEPGEDDILGHVRYYEIVVEIDESDFKATAIIPGDDETEWALTDDFFELAEAEEECPTVGNPDRMCAQYKYEILVRTNVYDADGNPVILEIDGEEDNLPGNKSAVESCFLVPEDVD